jgi:hypothetical protein
MTLLTVLFFSSAGVLAHTLHERGLAPGALSWPAVDRRGPGRPSDEDWEAAELAAGRKPRRETRRSQPEKDGREDRRRRREQRRHRRPPPS